MLMRLDCQLRVEGHSRDDCREGDSTPPCAGSRISSLLRSHQLTVCVMLLVVVCRDQNPTLSTVSLSFHHRVSMTN